MSGSTGKIQLGVETRDETADVYVIDGSFQVVKRGRGKENSFDLDPGIYSVKVRVGLHSEEQDVILFDTEEKVFFEAIEFPSAIPLGGTALTHDYHSEAAANESRKIHIRNGKGSWVYIFTRDWKPAQTGSAIKTSSFPQKGLKLLAKNGETIVDFEKDKNIAADKTQDAWAACNIELDPGEYRLSVEIDKAKTIEQTIIACRGWQTQVFLLLKNYSAVSDRRADLTNTGILMTRGSAGPDGSSMVSGGFDPHDPQMRLTDLARIGLAHHRLSLPKDVIARLLDGKIDNPMLGILGAYILLNGKKIRLGSFGKMIASLRKMLGEGTHPDLEALMLRLDRKNAKYDFDLPPMLRHGWDQVVKSTAKDPGLIPAGSFAHKVSDHILGDDPWLLYHLEDQPSNDASDESIRFLLEHMNPQEHPGAAALKTNLLFDMQQLKSLDIKPIRISAQDFGPLEEYTAQDLVPPETTEGISETIDTKTMTALVAESGLPKVKVLEILERLADPSKES